VSTLYLFRSKSPRCEEKGYKSCPFVKIQNLGQGDGEFLLFEKLCDCRKVCEDLK
jgi:hypothetical protein